MCVYPGFFGKGSRPAERILTLAETDCMANTSPEPIATFDTHSHLRLQSASLKMKTILPILLLCASASAERPPNIVFIMSDELAYYELSHMGNPYIKTPRIDRFAAEGIRFTQALAGAPVCAPLRCNLMTGKHAGHASVRANDGGTPLRAGEPTIASILKAKGYATGGFGKWGCGTV